MQIEELRYGVLPENLEGTPREIRLGRRDRGRLLVVDRQRRKREYSRVAELTRWFSPGDVLVLNNSKRIPGVLRGRSPVGGQVECRFVDLEEDGAGLCRVFPMHDVGPGTQVTLAERESVRILETGLTKYGLCRVRGEGAPLRDLLKRHGEPIPGFFYEGPWSTGHLNPYFATEEGGVESPLAGLHFTPELVGALRECGIAVGFITLHSVGSWLPFLESDVADHVMWPEVYRVPDGTAQLVNDAKARGKRVFACGSTCVRALETAAVRTGQVRTASGRTSLYIAPGYAFKVVDGYFTNFHQFQTSLIVLDVAFAGKDLVLESYKEASARGYSFYEFGDAVLYL